MPKDKVHPETFKGCHKKFAPVKSASVAADRHNKTKTEAQVKRSQARQTKKSRAVLNKLSKMGIQYSPGGVERGRSVARGMTDETTLLSVAVAPSPTTADPMTPAEQERLCQIVAQARIDLG
ncbi:MKI67 FHA domain-interacting nucleolar phosphoprotein-like [Littorina saxatilis]|uniref:MKI67 FHA domain-interacting nucleolar phosphoprotein-like n=1 Tax=Littorina saxatilis TaxID=31220 RepID=UPI0038B44BFD